MHRQHRDSRTTRVLSAGDKVLMLLSRQSGPGPPGVHDCYAGQCWKQMLRDCRLPVKFKFSARSQARPGRLTYYMTPVRPPRHAWPGRRVPVCQC